MLLFKYSDRLSLNIYIILYVYAVRLVYTYYTDNLARKLIYLY